MCVKWACCVITITSCDVFVKWISFNVLCKMSILCDDKHRVMCVNWWYTYDVSVKWKSHVIMIHMGYQCLCEIYIPCDDDTYVIFLWDEHPTVMIMNITWCLYKMNIMCDDDTQSCDVRVKDEYPAHCKTKLRRSSQVKDIAEKYLLIYTTL